MRLVSLALVLVLPGFARPYPAAERAARYTVYHRAKDGNIRVKVLIWASKCTNKGQLTDLMRQVREAKPVFDAPEGRALPVVPTVDLATFLGNR